MTGAPAALITPAFAGVCVGLSLWLTWLGSGRQRLSARAPVHALAPGSQVPREARPSVDSSAPGQAGPRADRLGPGLAVLSGVAVAMLLGGPAGWLAGLVSGAGLHRWRSSVQSRALRQRKERLAADLPVVADLLAGCLAAGCGVDVAVEAVASALGGPTADVLRRALANLRLGADPVECWQGLDPDAVLAPLGRALARAAASGAPVVDVMARLAEEQRRERRWRAEARARRAGVQAVAPLGLCFLPAFVLLAIVPVVAGIAQSVLPGLR